MKYSAQITKSIVTFTWLALIACAVQAQTIYLGSPGHARAMTSEQRAAAQRERATTRQQPLNLEAQQANEQHNNRIVYSPHDTIEGKRLPQYGVEGWQFAFSFPQESDPISSAYPDRYGFGQRGKAWFLSPGPDLDNINLVTIAEGTVLFISETVFTDNRDKDPTATIAKMRAELAAFTDTVEVEISVDGMRVKNIRDYRFQSPVFSYFLPQNSAVIGTHPDGGGFYYPALFDGYCVMVKPLSVGNHVIKARFKAPDFSFSDQWNVKVIKLVDPAEGN